MKKNKLALNLSKTSIQLLRKGNKKNWYVLGSADPSSENLEKDLARLRNQAADPIIKKANSGCPSSSRISSLSNRSH